MLIGSQDKDLEAMIRSLGARVGVLPMDQLTTLAEPSIPQPDLVVLDLRERPVVPSALAALKRHHASTGVVIVASTPDPELMLTAMRAGVNECLIEPLTEQAVETAVMGVISRTATADSSRVFAFVGAKGGVGTTALAVNVATSLSSLSASGALLIDLHACQSDAALYLGVEPRFSVMDALENIHKLDEAYFRTVVTRGPGRLKLLAAPETPGRGPLETSRVRALLEFAAKRFDYVVVDVSRQEESALDALEAAKSIVVVTTQELPAVRAATRLAGRLGQRHGKDRVQVVVTRHDKQSEIRHEDVERVLGASVTHTFPSDYRLTMAALNKGRPIVLDNHSKLAASFKSFSHQLAGLKATEQSEASGGWFGWMAKAR